MNLVFLACLLLVSTTAAFLSIKAWAVIMLIFVGIALLTAFIEDK